MKTTISHTWKPCTFGIDKVIFAFPIATPRFHQSIWQTGKWARNGLPRIEIPLWDVGTKVQLAPFKAPLDSHWSCSCQFNPSRVVDPFGSSLCHLKSFRPVIEMVLALMASSTVEPLVDIDQMSVRRLDVARDFLHISEPAQYVLGLRSVPRPYARRISLHSGGYLKNLTLEAGSRSGGWAKIYDKSANGMDGRLRFELEAKGWCQSIGSIITVSDLTDHNIRRLVRNRMRWFGLESEIMNFDTFFDRIDAAELDCRIKIGLLRYGRSLQIGRVQGISQRTENKYKKMIRELGFAVLPDQQSRADFLVRRLDWRSGREVIVG